MASSLFILGDSVYLGKEEGREEHSVSDKHFSLILLMGSPEG